MNIHTQTLAAICATCPHHVHSDELPANLPPDRRMAVCEIGQGMGGSGGRVPIPVRITVGNCPIGKFPRSVVKAREKGKRCGCRTGVQPPVPSSADVNTAASTVVGAAIVRWPRWAERATMYRVSKRTRRLESSEGWRARGGLEWYGLPMPLRWWIMARYGVVRSYHGCGCLVWLKQRAPWLDGPLTLLERVRLQLVAPLCVWWHARHVSVEIPAGSVRVDNPAWRPLPRAWLGRDGKGTGAAWVLAGLLMLAVLCLARAVV